MKQQLSSVALVITLCVAAVVHGQDLLPSRKRPPAEKGRYCLCPASNINSNERTEHENERHIHRAQFHGVRALSDDGRGRGSPAKT